MYPIKEQTYLNMMIASMNKKQEYLLKTRNMLLVRKENLIKKKKKMIQKNKNGIVIITSSIIISVGILLSGGIYSFDSSNVGLVQRYNKFTGRIELCVSRNKNDQCQIINKGLFELTKKGDYSDIPDGFELITETPK